MVGGNHTRDFALDDGPGKDTELTLGPWLLIGLGCALIAVCAVCFGVGYRMGRNSAPTANVEKAPAANTAVTSPTAQTTAAAAKPGARGNSTYVPAPAPVSGDGALEGEAPAAISTPAATPTVAATPVVHPALSATPSALTTPAPPPVTNGPMVQIAAVSHQEDADVLMSALRRRGYAVVTRHVPGDNLIHVQVGPFATRAEATAMAQRLLGDGYNAAVQ
ncbi:MAG TPA: SPOR domain-containing protein [Terracidiphilus sp.]|nr:SPOR domain-containing protein [Terracidiphilus sp.]